MPGHNSGSEWKGQKLARDNCNQKGRKEEADIKLISVSCVRIEEPTHSPLSTRSGAGVSNSPCPVLDPDSGALCSQIWMWWQDGVSISTVGNIAIIQPLCSGVLCPRFQEWALSLNSPSLYEPPGQNYMAASSWAVHLTPLLYRINTRTDFNLLT